MRQKLYNLLRRRLTQESRNRLKRRISRWRRHVAPLHRVRYGAFGAEELRDELARHLAKRGIQTLVNYPTALPFLPAYRRLGHTPAKFPVAYGHQSRILSLPIFPEITAQQIAAVVAGVRSFGAQGSV